MVFTDTKGTGSQILSADWNAMVIDQRDRSPITSGAGAPSSAPAQIGAIYIDHDSSPTRIYIATGSTASSDFKKVLST